MGNAKFHQRCFAFIRAGVRRCLIHFPGMLPVVRNTRVFLSPDSRAVQKLQRHRSRYLLQPFPTTKIDRHPALFTFAKERLAGKSELSILSFGCSTGEEPLSLANYFPDANIDAIDINPRSIAIARRNAAKQGVNQINFSVGDHPPQVADRYDAVFCLSVLRHGRLDADQPAMCSDIFPFSKFEAVVAALDLTIRTGGLLLIWGSNFRFSDCAAASRYQMLSVPGMRPHSGAFYGPDDILLQGEKARIFAFEKLQ